MLKVPENIHGVDTNDDSIVAPATPDSATLFDHCKVRDAMTELNRAGEEFVHGLRVADPATAGDMPAQAEAFVRERAEALAAGLGNHQQRRLFEADLAAYRQGLAPRVEAVREGKTREYRSGVSDRQGLVLIGLATSPDSVFDDARLEGIRSLYLAGAEQAVVDLSGTEKRERLREREAALYRPVLDTRLDHAPDKAAEMASAPAVAEALGEESAGQYRAQAWQAIADQADREAARSRLASGLPPNQAERGLSKQAASLYREYRYRDNLARAGRLMDEAGEQWARLASDPDPEAIPASVRRNSPELAGFLERQVAARRRSGGVAGDTGYVALLELTADHRPAEAAESLAAQEGFYAVLERLGGADSPAAAVYMRLVQNQVTPADEAWLRDLRQAGEALGQGTAGDGGESGDVAGLDSRLAEYAAARNEYLRRTGHAALMPSERAELLRSLS